MYNEASIKQAKWITAPKEIESPIIERRFFTGDCICGRIEISAFGFFILSINGKRVGDEYYLPSNSLFRERALSDLIYPISDEFTYRCYYSEYDITSYLQEGENLLEIHLGNGWYRQTERVAEGMMCFGESLGAIYAITFTDDLGEKIIYSDGTERCRESQIQYSQLFIGEKHDARLLWEQKQYFPVEVDETISTKLSPEDSIPDRIVREVQPKLIFCEGERKVYDVGENVSGVVAVKVRPAWGEEVKIRFSENISGSQLDFFSTGSQYITASGKPQIMEDVFVGDGEEHCFSPLFVWHAFRYFEILGKGETISVSVVHSDVKQTGFFVSDSDELNLFFRAYVRSQLNNMHGGVPSDCPHRERLGYTGDGQICAPAAMMIFDCKAFYRKWIRDIFDSQDKKSGHVNHTAPFSGGGGGPGAWGCAAVIVPYRFYQEYGDVSVVAEYYEKMKRWIDYLEKHSEADLVTHEEKGGWCLGDWCTPEKTEIPESFVNTCYFIKSLKIMEEFSSLLGKKTDCAYFVALRKRAEEAVKKTFYNEKSGRFSDGVQGADAYAVWVGLGGEKTLSAVASQYERMKHFDTGFVGTDILCEVLFEHDMQDVAYELLTSHELGSFPYMIDRGATTLWEDWDGSNSHDHPMFGASARYLISYLLGIRQREGSVGFQNTIIAPKIPKKLKWASGGRMTKWGEIRVKWHKEKEKIFFEIMIPNGMTCEFFYGGKEQTLRGGNHMIVLPL